MQEPDDTGPPHLKWAGASRSVKLSVDDDAEAMDIALALVPELRLAALAVVRARALRVEFPIVSVAELQQLLGGDDELSAAGHQINAAEIRRFLVPGDLPIENEGALVTVVYVALQRCLRREQLEQDLRSFDAALAADPDSPVGS